RRTHGVPAVAGVVCFLGLGAAGCARSDAVAQGPPAGDPVQAPRTAAEAARHYSITRSSARLMDVYAAAVAGPSPSHHVKEAPSS
ncbi:hypothetical protein STREPTOSP366_22560, partial [Streptomyces variabilis]